METPPKPIRSSDSPGRSLQSTEHSPGTPKPPFDPPRRRSSLAFSKIISSPVSIDQNDALDQQDADMQTPDRPKSNISKKRIVSTPFRQSGVTPGHVAHIQRFFQSAKASLHLDMHFAASPVGSIDSRLPSNVSPSSEACRDEEPVTEAEDSLARNWRYSTVPQLLATTNLDVREPLPDSSPTLPGFSPQLPNDSPMSFEPTSSGFASPLEGLDRNVEIELPPLPPSSPPGSLKDNEPVVALEDSMMDLGINSGGHSVLSDVDNSPLPDHSRKQSTASSDSPIFLSQSAKAAAQSARAKRGLARRFDPDTSNDDIPDSNTDCAESNINRTPQACPDPAIHQMIEPRLCPDPEIHGSGFTPRSFPGHSFTPNSQRRPGMQQIRGIPRFHHNALPALRASATGSPLPFQRSKGPVSPILPGGFPRQSSFVPPSPIVPRINRPCRQPQGPPVTASEHFQPGWYYARDSPQRRNRPGGDVYSFSTAAAKVTGESAAPDWRIRDSYRTDTLTPLVKPLNRFRKNGLGAEAHRRESARSYEPPSLPSRPLGRMRSYSGRNEYESIDRVRFRSSPSRPSTSHTSGHDIRKRRRNPRAYTPELDIEDSMMVDPRFGPEDAMIIDDDTRAAVRMSIFGSSTPEPLHGEREGIRELSPNVSTWRKGMRGAPQSRKKRRPSYWDGDLKEVKESPAGRGGIASSPTISKRSMVADLETISNQSAAASIIHDLSTAGGRFDETDAHKDSESYQDESMMSQDSEPIKVAGDDDEDVEEMGTAAIIEDGLVEVSMQG